jgi:hypothetical protein
MTTRSASVVRGLVASTRGRYVRAIAHAALAEVCLRGLHSAGRNRVEYPGALGAEICAQ